MRRAALLAGAAAAAVALLPATTAGAGAIRTVKIGDNYYTPEKLTVKRGTTVRWLWPSDTGDTHDVKLQKGPTGAKRFHSEEAGSAYSFKRKLTVPGTYKIVCTLHEEMRQTITVKR